MTRRNINHTTRFNPSNVTNGTAYRIDCDAGSTRIAHYLGDDRVPSPYWVEAQRALVFATHDDAVAYARARIDGEHAQYNRAQVLSIPGPGWRVEQFNYTRGVVYDKMGERSDTLVLARIMCGALEQAKLLATMAWDVGAAAWPVMLPTGDYVAVQTPFTSPWAEDADVTVDQVDLVPATYDAMRNNLDRARLCQRRAGKLWGDVVRC